MEQASVVFFGTPNFALPALKAIIAHPNLSLKLVVTQPDRPVGRKQILTAPPVKCLAIEHKIPVFQPENLRKMPDAGRQLLEAYGPFDIGLVIAFGQILPAEILKLPKAGCINIHASLLPRWRGAAPIQRALMAGDKVSGVCLMQMDEGLDTGPVFCSESVAINELNSGELHDVLANLGARLLTREISLILEGKIQPTPQPDSGTTYAAKITDKDCAINWDQPACAVLALIRGLAPGPGAHTLLHGKRLKILSGSLASQADSQTNLTPGLILNLTNADFRVSCSNGTISISSVQLEGKPKMLVSEYLKGQRPEVGTRLG